MANELTSFTEEVVPVKLAWFHFSQNNSGGYFITDENMAADVFIQARSAEEAIAKGDSFFDYSYCECCGERWSTYLDDSDGHALPTVYGELYGTKKPSWSMRDEARFHFFDGRVATVDKNNPPFYLDAKLELPE